MCFFGGEVSLKCQYADGYLFESHPLYGSVIVWFSFEPRFSFEPKF